jgi:hypothetical protein
MCGVYRLIENLGNMYMKVAVKWLCIVHKQLVATAAYQTCSVGVWVYRPWKNFQLSGIVYRSLRHGAVHYHAEMWWQRMNGTTMGLKISSRYLCAFKLPSEKNVIVFVVCNVCLHIP